MKSKTVLSVVILLGLLLASITQSGCSLAAKQPRPIVLHPIQKSDIFSIPAGAEVVIKKGTEVRDPKTNEVVERWDQDTTITTEKAGWFLSDYYLTEVAEAQVNR